ncbi:MAG: hypothetical protein U9N59_03740 [Campylobacterota bacterium]|nr:hypothetical protein [Campylobacterota bacterium]
MLILFLKILMSIGGIVIYLATQGRKCQLYGNYKFVNIIGSFLGIISFVFLIYNIYNFYKEYNNNQKVQKFFNRECISNNKPVINYKPMDLTTFEMFEKTCTNNNFIATGISSNNLSQDFALQEAELKAARKLTISIYGTQFNSNTSFDINSIKNSHSIYTERNIAYIPIEEDFYLNGDTNKFDEPIGCAKVKVKLNCNNILYKDLTKSKDI